MQTFDLKGGDFCLSENAYFQFGQQWMEELKSESISIGARTSLYNARGAHWRGEGGDQERELAKK